MQPSKRSLNTPRLSRKLRREGVTRALPVENIGRLHALGFTLEQLRRDLEDFHSRVVECARAAE
jgi:hypothetical protein